MQSEHSSVAWWIFVVLLVATIGPARSADPGWRFLEQPRGGVVRDLKRVPTDPNILYAATWADLDKSSDGGATWHPQGIQEAISAVAVSPLNSSFLLAGTDDGHLKRSVDGGLTWTDTTPSRWGSAAVLGLDFDPSQPATVYASFLTVSGTMDPPIMKSVDGGVTWMDASNGLIEPGSVTDQFPATVNCMAVDPDNPSTLSAIDDFGFLYRSLDRGESWAVLSNTGGRGRCFAIEVDPGDSSVLYAGLGLLGIYRSEDGGATWTRTGGFGSPRDFAFAPGLPQIVYAATAVGVVRSGDGGLSWAEANTGMSDSIMTTVLVDPADPQHLQAAGLVGVFETVNGGSTWSQSNEGMFHRWVSSLLVDRAHPSTVLAATRSSALHRSENDGETWSRVPLEVSSQELDSLVAAPSDPSRLYLTTESGSVFRSSDGGLSWTKVFAVAFDGSAMAVHPSDPQTVYLALNDFSTVFLRRTTDGGETWTSLPPLSFGSASSLLIDPEDPSTLYLATSSRVLKSTDGALTWSTLSGEQLPFGSFRLTLDPRDSSNIYAFGRFLGVYRSLDRGATWQPIQEGLPSMTINALLVDPDNGSVLYGAPMDGGVYRSLDRGKTWSPFNIGFPVLSSIEAPNVTSLAVASTSPNRRLYAGVFSLHAPSGVYVRSMPSPSLVPRRLRVR